MSYPERDGQVDEELALRKMMRLGYRGRIDELDAEGRSLLWRSGDLRARFLLMDSCEAIMAEELTRETRRAWCQLTHAAAYLADRLSYELYPWPKNKFKLEVR